jgi:Fur family iron response transcriptional regulator
VFSALKLRERISRLLEDHGVKPTPQRLEIGEMILAEPCHLSAEQLIVRLRDAGSSVSKATVYNTLNLFSRRGILREVAVDPARLFYDSTTSSHHHFYNEDTGELIDIDQAGLAIERMPELPEGTQATSLELVIRIRQIED